MKEKEFRVYVNSANSITNGICIDIWNDCEQSGKELPKEAKKFINTAEENGSVYSLKGFMTANNISK